MPYNGKLSFNGEYDSLRAELRSVARMHAPAGAIAADNTSLREWKYRFTIGLSRFETASKIDFRGSFATERYPGGVTMFDQPDTNWLRALARKR